MDDIFKWTSLFLNTEMQRSNRNINEVIKWLRFFLNDCEIQIIQLKDALEINQISDKIPNF